jgi:DNA-binding LacI/PurR family transcriptional regulator
MSTIKEVAKYCGFSVATVSRVLNDDPIVKPETREKVLAAIEALNYRPNLMAKNLRTQKSNSILVMIPTIANPFYAEILRGIEQGVKETEMNPIIGTVEFDPSHTDHFLALLDSNQADGVIFISSSITSERLAEVAKKHPAVMCNEYFDPMPVSYVAINNEEAAYEAACELAKMGCERVAYFSGARDSSSSIDRSRGVKRAKEENKCVEVDIIRGDDDFHHLKDKICKVLSEKPNIDGLIMNSDINGTVAIRALVEMGLVPGKDVRIVSFDGTMISELTTPMLTCVKQPLFDLGYLAVRLLENQMKEKDAPFERLILPHEFCIRET